MQPLGKLSEIWGVALELSVLARQLLVNLKLFQNKSQREREQGAGWGWGQAAL